MPQKPLTPKRPCHIWDNTDFSRGSGQRDLGATLTLMQKPEKAPTPRSRESPRNLSITSNFVSPAVAKDESRTGVALSWNVSWPCPLLARAPVYPSDAVVARGESVNLTCWNRDQLEGSPRILKGKMGCSGDELSPVVPWYEGFFGRL